MICKRYVDKAAGAAFQQLARYIVCVSVLWHFIMFVCLCRFYYLLHTEDATTVILRDAVREDDYRNGLDRVYRMFATD